MSRSIRDLYKHFPKDTFKPDKVDRGKEFAGYFKVEADLNVSVYFAAAYSSRGIGNHENAKGLLRENFLKQTDWVPVGEEEIHETLSLMTHRSRKILGWKTSWVTYPRGGILPGRESSYFMSKCRICIDNLLYKNVVPIRSILSFWVTSVII